MKKKIEKKNKKKEKKEEIEIKRQMSMESNLNHLRCRRQTIFVPIPKQEGRLVFTKFSYEVQKIKTTHFEEHLV